MISIFRDMIIAIKQKMKNPSGMAGRISFLSCIQNVKMNPHKIVIPSNRIVRSYFDLGTPLNNSAMVTPTNS